MRLLLRSGASPDLPNNNGKTPLSIARERGYHLCEELVSPAITTQLPQLTSSLTDNEIIILAAARSGSEEDNVRECQH